MSGPETLTESPSFLTATGSKTILKEPRLNGRGEDSTIENKAILEVKLKKPEEMSRRIDLHRSTIDCNFRTPRSLVTFRRAFVKQEARAIGMF